MHTTQDLTESSFTITVDGRRAGIQDVFPEFDERDRLGMISRSPCGVVGASALILATVTAFYELQRRRSDDFFVYPDYFVFHAGGPVGDHKMFDIFPAHKEVVVEDDPEEILRAINDRAVTRLLIEDGPPADPEFGRPTLASVGVRTAVAYSPGGRVEGADLSVTGNEATEEYVGNVLDGSEALDAGAGEGVRAGRATLMEDDRPLETYRRLAVDEALARLSRPQR
ncbi:hypothetical protein [Rubrobacter aplysinae]|uniref:hypothetical protein n=1 Tax=Rubrobacter aplysinae TaxID=909625 RepID=UPI00064BA2C5|nr:hypothetical protein [Rubrobacter aplysinae]